VFPVWIIQHVKAIIFFGAIAGFVNVIAKIPESAFFDDPLASLIANEVADGEKVEMEVLKAKGDGPLNGFAHEPLPPIGLGQNIADFAAF
jgi:hypothetical protein